MSNEMKLLMAFIEASGFIVVTTLDFKERRMHESQAMTHNKGFSLTEYTLKSDSSGRLDIDKDGLYLAQLTNPVVNYKVKKL